MSIYMLIVTEILQMFHSVPAPELIQFCPHIVGHDPVCYH